MYTWFKEDGTKVRTKTVKQFAERYGLRESNARSLASGCAQYLKGWMSSHPRSKARRKRVMTEFVNSKTGERFRIGKAVAEFCRKHGLAKNDVYKVVNGRILSLKGWMLASTYDIARESIAGVDL
jgi:Mor family transcriptional regulator